MKKFELHLDALVTIMVVFTVAFGFILYQRYQYSDLLQEIVDLRWEMENTNANLILKTALLDHCKEENKTTKDSIEENEASAPDDSAPPAE